MWFYITMFICNLLIPIIMLIAGFCMCKNPPKKINGFIGYRTKRSMKNTDTWQFAHMFCGKIWIKTGIVMLIFSVIAPLPFTNSSDNTIGFVALVIEALQLIVLIGSILPTENALKKTFDEDGIKR